MHTKFKKTFNIDLTYEGFGKYFLKGKSSQLWLNSVLAIFVPTCILLHTKHKLSENKKTVHFKA